ncbi:MAG: nitroreductase family deazaflavin-dependent oxidoreductase [Actinophytocola sp.]|uniref:nitroreductase/quinone reductase family protein n=1 Tax=Actinophytocola sp. TaxID=1872138 RepID=UPI0013279321|nr:nitroreductase/quinone reductase family protein [Actinophytocola sp.]MPZ79511.1 nitroreductase family deazaflavin-dependent oxidoreductase [Actinophytocola sp.]
MSDFNAQVIAEFRANGGAVGGPFEGAPLVLLTTAGARTGRPHTNPAVHLRDGGRYLVFASNAGGPNNPAWYHNMLASPRVTVEIGTGTGEVTIVAARAVPLTGDERDRCWELQCSIDPAFRAYEARTTRTIPVIALHPLDLSADPARARMVGQQLRRHHDDLRADLLRLRTELDGAGAGPAPDVAEQLRRRCLIFCYGLQLHHTRENGAFTAFEDHLPELRPAIARLRAEHRDVEEALAGFEATLTSGDTDAAALRAELDRVVEGLERHFAYEEQELVTAVS